MSEEPVNPYYFYDEFSREDLKEALAKRVFEFDSYIRWAERSLEEVKYIQMVLRMRKK